MANQIVYRSLAEKYLAENGWKLFLDWIIRDRAIIMDDPKIKVIYENNAFMQTKGIIRLEEWPEGLVLWVGGRIVWEESKCQ